MLAAAGVDTATAAIENVVFAEAITTTDEAEREVRCTIGAAREGRHSIEVTSRWTAGGEPTSDWTSHFTGELTFCDDPLPADLDLDELRDRAATTGDLGELYERARREDIVHGPAMRCAGPLWRGPQDDPYLLAELTLEQGDPDHVRRFHLHPAMLDASTLAGFALTEVSGNHPFIPMFVQRFRAPRRLAPTSYVHCARPERLAESGDVITSDYRLVDADGRFLAEFTGLTCKLIRDPKLIRRLLPGQGDETETPSTTGETAESAPVPTKPEGDLTAVIRGLVARTLDVDEAGLASDVGFYDLGLDSLGVLALGRELEQLVGESLYPTLLFEHSTIDALVGYLRENHTIEVAAAPTSADETSAPPAADAELILRTPLWTAADAATDNVDRVAVVDTAAGKARGSGIPRQRRGSRTHRRGVASGRPARRCPRTLSRPTRADSSSHSRGPPSTGRTQPMRRSPSPARPGVTRCCLRLSPRCAARSTPRRRNCVVASRRDLPTSVGSRPR